MTPGIIDFLSFKCSPAAKLVALHLALVTSSTATRVETIRVRDIAKATSLPGHETEAALRELMRLAWIKSPRPDEILMPADSPARAALAKPSTPNKKAAKSEPTETVQ